FILWAGAQIVASTVLQPHYMAGICLDHANEGVAYACLGNNDRSTLWKLTTADGGATWAFERISSQDDGAQNIRPHVPWNLSTPGDGAHPKHPVLWMRGSYDDYDGPNYSTDIVSLNGLELDQPALTSDWSRKCAITLDAASGGSDLTDFTVLLTEANLPSEIFTE